MLLGFLAGVVVAALVMRLWYFGARPFVSPLWSTYGRLKLRLAGEYVPPKHLTPEQVAAIEAEWAEEKRSRVAQGLPV